VRTLYLAAVVVAIAACRRSDDSIRRSDSTVTPPVSVDTSHVAVDTADSVPDCGVTGTATIENDGIGQLKVGRKVDDVRSLCEVTSDAQELGTEGMKERVLTVNVGGTTVKALIDKDRVMRIAVSSPALRTRDSLGVDTPLHTLADKRGARFVPGEDGVYGFVADHCGLSFRFAIPMRPPTGRDWTADGAKREHGGASVNRVLITSCAR
jgi:hypothetical protein